MRPRLIAVDDRAGRAAAVVGMHASMRPRLIAVDDCSRICSANRVPNQLQ